MKLIIILFAVMFISGCSTLRLRECYTFNSGSYIIEVSRQEPNEYDVIIELDFNVKNGEVEITDPTDGDIMLYGLIKDNMFLSAQIDKEHDMTLVSYRGNLVGDNRIEGTMSGRTIERSPLGRSIKFSEKPKVTEFSGSFKIYPADEQEDNDLSFLPIVEYGQICDMYDPRGQQVILPSDNLVSVPKGIGIWGLDTKYDISLLTPISNKELIDELIAKTKEYGLDIPILLYIDKDVSYSSVKEFLKECSKTKLSNYSLMYQHPVWKSTVMIEVSTNLTLADEELSRIKHSISFNKNGYSLLKENVVIGTYKLNELRDGFEKQLSDDPIGHIMLEPENDTKAFELAMVISTMREFDLEACLKLDNL